MGMGRGRRKKAQSFQSFCVSFPSAGVIGRYHHVKPESSSIGFILRAQISFTVTLYSVLMPLLSSPDKRGLVRLRRKASRLEIIETSGKMLCLVLEKEGQKNHF